MSEVTFRVLSRRRYRCLYPGCKAIVKQAHLDGHRNAHRQQPEPRVEKPPPSEPMRRARRNRLGDVVCPYC